MIGVLLILRPVTNRLLTPGQRTFLWGVVWLAGFMPIWMELMGRIPADKVRVSESALKSNADLKQMKRHGADAFLIGETLMRAASPGEKLCELIAK